MCWGLKQSQSWRELHLAIKRNKKKKLSLDVRTQLSKQHKQKQRSYIFIRIRRRMVWRMDVVVQWEEQWTSKQHEIKKI